MNELNRCQAKRKMTVRKEIDFPADESPATAKFPANLPGNSGSDNLGGDFYTQAFKALSERSPFDLAEVLAKTSLTLPSELANLFSKRSESRKKHKRPNSDNKSSKKSSKKSKSSNFWVELEGYFRELELEDIERLYRFSSPFSLLESSNSCLVIPSLSNVSRNNDSEYNEVEYVHAGDVISAGNVVLVENVVTKENGCAEVDGILDSETVEIKAEIENGGRDAQCSVLDSLVQSCSSSIEWVLGCRNRVLLTTLRPTKKRKLLGDNAGLERLMVAQPYEGSPSLCHVCSVGDTGDQLNQLVVCRSCKVVVHRKCYGIEGEVDKSWVCSWCKYKSDGAAGHGLSSNRPCVLCPKSGGACKRFERAGGEGSVEFAHLFCCQWMPEVHIDNTRMMEPLLCVEGMHDVRGKLVCNLCKIKLGSCVRCSYGSCRTSFHPICAREARNQLEIWGKFGCDDIELRAFCSKHSGNSVVSGSGTLELNDVGDALGSDSLDNIIQQGNKIKKLKIGFKNGDKVTFSIGAADFNTKSSEEHVLRELMQKDIMSNTELKSGSSDLQEFNQVEASAQKSSSQDKASYLDLGVVLKKLLERGKASLEQIASEIGITEDSLASKLIGNHLGPEMSCKILKWLRDHAYIDNSEKDLRAKVRLLLPPKAELASHYHSDAVAIIDLDMPDVPVKSVPPRRRTIGNFVKQDKVIPLWNDKLLGNDESINEVTEQEQVNGEHDCSSKDSVLDGMEKMMVETNGFEHPLEEPSESIVLKSINRSDIECNGAEEVMSLSRSSILNSDQELPCSINAVNHCDGDIEPGADSFVHPFIQKKLEEVQCLLVQKIPLECNGGTEADSSAMDQSSTPNFFLNDNVDDDQRHAVKLEDLHTAKNMGILDLSPENELEGEIIFSQQRLLHNIVALKYCADQLVCKVVRRLPYEMDAVRKQRWDGVLVNQYIYELKEARKQGRKERRHKEAQAVLAAATAAVAVSSRVSSVRKDSVDGSSQLEVVTYENSLKNKGSRIHDVLSLVPVPRPKEFNSSFDVPKVISDGYPDKEQLKSCDVCRRTESLLNPILVCLSCKVAVHLNCYRCVKESAGPWFCELCEESSLSKASRSNLEKPYPIAECGLCGASNGAFRKSSNGQWIHAFCAEWVFDSTFRRGQVSHVAGMETVLKGDDMCSVCHRRFGVCIKCNNGNCEATFHPSCARSAGYYMYTKYVGGGKMQHKAYCCKHSFEHKAKADTQKHDAEDFKIVKQHRVELEKLRLLCERIVKREKLKRELALCNFDILASRRDSLAVSMLSRRPCLEYEGSSESATTSLRGHSRSCSEAMQKSDDVTVDSALSSKRCIRFPLNIYNDRKTDDGSASQRIPTPKPTERVLFAGKQIPVRATLTTGNFLESGEKMLKSKKSTETFEKELVMTSDQASLRNRRLPKGYFYVPLDCLSTEKQAGHDSAEQEEVDG